ncbi:MAG TPA: hypothetical protein VIG26_01155, partial [Methyloceanibacter sp.]
MTDFRSVADSDWIDVDRVTAFIGVNESGKTNLLLPLWKFSPAREGELQPTSDYPKKLFGAIREKPGNYKFISVEFDASDLATQVSNLSGVSKENLRRVIVDRYFDGLYTVYFPDAVPARYFSVKETREILEHGKTAIPGLFSSLYCVLAGRFPERRMCESIGDNPNQRLSHAGFVAGDFAGHSG